MFTTVSISMLAHTDLITEIRYDFISKDDEIAFDIGTIHVAEYPIEEFLTETKKEN